MGVSDQLEIGAASGIEQALVTTIAGLCVAIPALLVAFCLTGRVRQLMLQVDDLLSPAVEVLTKPAGKETRKERRRAT